MTTQPIEKIYVNADKAAYMLDIGRSTFYAGVKAHTLPQPRIVCGVKRWLVADLRPQHPASSTTTPSSPGA